MEGQIVIRTAGQANALADFIREQVGGDGDGDVLLITQQSDGAIYTATTLSSRTILADGEYEDA